jgi:MFS family permease
MRMSTSHRDIDLGVSRVVGSEKSGFFLTAHTFLLGLVLVGFAPTFFLRAFFDVPPIPAVLYVHGAVMALWFVFGPLQGWLMRRGERKWHRRIGYVAAAYAVAFVVLGLIANGRPCGRSLRVAWGPVRTLPSADCW